MFKHCSAAVNRLTIGAMSPIVVGSRELVATAALFGVKMFFFVISIYGALATVAPNDKQIAGLRIDFSRHNQCDNCSIFANNSCGRIGLCNSKSAPDSLAFSEASLSP